jgi:hypothetical protein
LKDNGDIVLNTDSKIFLGGEDGNHPVALADQIKDIFDTHTHSAPSGGGTTSIPNNSFPNGSASVFSK